MSGVLAPGSLRDAGRITGVMIPVAGHRDADWENVKSGPVDVLKNGGRGLEGNFIFCGVAAEEDGYFFLIHQCSSFLCKRKTPVFRMAIIPKTGVRILPLSPQLFFFSLRKFLSFSYERGRVTVKIMLSSPLAASMEPP